MEILFAFALLLGDQTTTKNLETIIISRIIVSELREQCSHTGSMSTDECTQYKDARAKYVSILHHTIDEQVP